MKILLHICCAPCAIKPVEELRAAGFDVTGFFYNPNIHPFAEYNLREESVKRFASAAALPVIYGDYEIDRFFQGIVYGERTKDRCPVCWWLRLEKVVQHAFDNKFDGFTTSLLASPYQDHDLIKNLCDDISRRTKVTFFYTDFRKSFKEGHKRAKEMGLYRQSYCGCLFSELEKVLGGQKAADRSPKKA